MTNNQQAEKILQAKNLSMAFGGLMVFKNISLNIIKHQIVALIGPNGAGKTTLINCITGVYKPTQGNILFQDRTISGMRPHACVRTKYAAPALDAPTRSRDRL
jgi:branched-chain amino acid transport system ATP-binding protein